LFDSDSENGSEDDDNSFLEAPLSSESDESDSESEGLSTSGEGGVQILQTVDDERCCTQQPATITIDASKFRISKYESVNLI
jgi:hypothetical protein